MITGLRSLGLTLAEIQQFGTDYQARPGEHLGPRTAVEQICEIRHAGPSDGAEAIWIWRGAQSARA
jgi:hypothetical protein